jgi:hypothetical protein
MRNIICGFLLLFLFGSCSPFSKISSHTQIGTADSYTKVYNSKANFESLTFGDFKFAVNSKQFKSLNEKKPVFDKILVYAITTDKDAAYDYYILYNPQKSFNGKGYIVKEVQIQNTRLVLAISENAPDSDVKSLLDQITAMQ